MRKTLGEKKLLNILVKKIKAFLWIKKKKNAEIKCKLKILTGLHWNKGPGRLWTINTNKIINSKMDKFCYNTIILLFQSSSRTLWYSGWKTYRPCKRFDKHGLNKYWFSSVDRLWSVLISLLLECEHTGTFSHHAISRVLLESSSLHGARQTQYLVNRLYPADPSGIGVFSIVSYFTCRCRNCWALTASFPLKIPGLISFRWMVGSHTRSKVVRVFSYHSSSLSSCSAPSQSTLTLHTWPREKITFTRWTSGKVMSAFEYTNKAFCFAKF